MLGQVDQNTPAIHEQVPTVYPPTLTQSLTLSMSHFSLQSAGPQKESKSSKKEKGKKKKSFDTTQSSNSKLKYRQEGGGMKGPSSLAKQTHKQFPPTIALVYERTAGEEEGRLGRELDAVEENETVKEEVEEVEVVEEERSGELEPGSNGDGSGDKETGVGGVIGEVVDAAIDGEEDVVMEELDEEEKRVLLEEENIQQLEKVTVSSPSWFLK